ncbi:MAG: ribonuclease P protein component [Anaerolineales bacterium]
MDRRYRLKKSRDFQRVRNSGKAYTHPFFVLIYAPNSSSQTRIGVAAGRSIGNAVKRNRAKRRLRASIQPWIPQLAPGIDIVLIARKALLTASFSHLSQALEKALKSNQIVMDVNHACQTDTRNS